MVKYEFQGLLGKDKEGIVIGPMSPIMAAKTVAKSMNIHISGLVRMSNPQADSYTYDHLIIKSIFKNTTTYSIIIDMGVSIIPAVQYWEQDDEIIITPVYETEEAKRESHLANLEAPKRCNENPIIKLDDNGFRELFKQAIASNKFKVTDYENSKG